MAADPALTQADANSAAWHEGLKLLKRAIAGRKDFAFEATLGGNTDCTPARTSRVARH